MIRGGGNFDNLYAIDPQLKTSYSPETATFVLDRTGLSAFQALASGTALP